jgi:hypothetical protein
MARIERDGDLAPRIAAYIRLFGSGLAFGARIAGLVRRTIRRRGLVAPIPFEQRHQRVEGRQRIEIEHHAMPELGNGRQRKKLRPHLGAQIDHEPQRRGRLGTEANARDVRIGRLHAKRQLHQFGRQLDAFQIEHDSVRILQHEQLVRDGGGGFENQARVFLRRPQSRRRDPRRVRPGNRWDQ